LAYRQDEQGRLPSKDRARRPSLLRLARPLQLGLSSLDCLVHPNVRFSLIRSRHSQSALGTDLCRSALTSALRRIKAFTPVSVLLVSAAFKLKELNQKIMAIVACISLGVAIASYGEVEFELIGFLVQVSERRSVCVQLLTLTLQPYTHRPLPSE
jgi:hypothetical protein